MNFFNLLLSEIVIDKEEVGPFKSLLSNMPNNVLILKSLFKDHPILGHPVFHIHPCNTNTMMRNLVSEPHSDSYRYVL